MTTAVVQESTTAQALGLARSDLARIAEQFETEAGLACTADLAAVLGAVEQLFHVVEYLQVVGAAAADQQEIAKVGETRKGLDWSGPLGVPEDAHEFKDTADYLRARLGITRLEAQRRVRVGKYVLPRRTLTGEPCAALLESVGDAFRSGAISSYAAARISDAVERVRPCASDVQLQDMEDSLTAQATESDADLLNVVIRRWEAALDPDGVEPTEELLKAQQGVFLRGRRRGLHRLEIAADDEQFEYLLTVMNTATNPRTARSCGPEAVDTKGTGSESAGTGNGGVRVPSATVQSDADPSATGPSNTAPGNAAPGGTDTGNTAPGGTSPGGTDPSDDQPSWERRTRSQRQLDGLIGACQVALATDTLPATGGHRPQVMVTIDYRALVEDLREAGVARRRVDGAGGRVAGSWQDSKSWQGGAWAQNGQRVQGGQPTADAAPDVFGDPSAASRPHSEGGYGVFGDPSATSGSHPGGGYSVFGGPVTARTVRKVACDADIIPVVLGDRGEVLDVGRTRRLFGVAQRRAMVARDRGCAFPDCTVPAVWSEAHHVTPWVLGGRTDVSNGCLLCSFHHRLIERGNWTIEMKHGIPWFTPPPYIDPDRTPRRNRHRELTPCTTP